MDMDDQEAYFRAPLKLPEGYVVAPDSIKVDEKCLVYSVSAREWIRGFRDVTALFGHKFAERSGHHRHEFPMIAVPASKLYIERMANFEVPDSWSRIDGNHIVGAHDYIRTCTGTLGDHAGGWFQAITLGAAGTAAAGYPLVIRCDRRIEDMVDTHRWLTFDDKMIRPGDLIVTNNNSDSRYDSLSIITEAFRSEPLLPAIATKEIIGVLRRREELIEPAPIITTTIDPNYGSW